MSNSEAAWRLFVDPVFSTGNLAVWATHDTVRLEVNREDTSFGVDFLPDSIAGFAEGLMSGEDVLAFGCITDERGISLGGIGTAFTSMNNLDYLLHFAGEEVTGQVKPESIDAVAAGMHDAAVYASNVSSALWREMDSYIMGAAVMASDLGLSVMTPLRRMSMSMGFVAKKRASEAG